MSAKPAIRCWVMKQAANGGALGPSKQVSLDQALACYRQGWTVLVDPEDEAAFRQWLSEQPEQSATPRSERSIGERARDWQDEEGDAH